jgi:hypothetical protein
MIRKGAIIKLTMPVFQYQLCLGAPRKSIKKIKILKQVYCDADNKYLTCVPKKMIV